MTTVRSLLRVGALVGALVACQGGTAPAPAGEPIVFVGDAPGDVSGALVTMRGRADGDRIVVDVVGRNAPDVNGAALRVVFDPAVLAFVEATPGPKWSRMSLGAAKEGTPGQLAIAWGEKGGASFDATDESLLGTITFARKTKAATKIDFRGERSSLLDRKGVATPATFRGGNVTAAR